ncbi:MAG TPA: type IV pilus twitching motility protein PilT [Candidatus Hydrogenedens sp.]|nr:type IV pilus twitching motility protein PilT [Candidatus Hydrogenedens sp.]HOK08209.1 type IV pilus twitching motility protein PilT [Candidatus Hydrogenedens sp.]HOL20128.1 type IV pilus twitching motility protein PilT [Candidatus Hydrogenedens sp.]HPP58678.1 type IV pilus twitching motility protein PilT [Candidatus Hydrogenedens sp.]
MPIPLKELMEMAINKNASDIHLKHDNPPILRIDGILRRIEGDNPLTDDDLKIYLSEIASPADILKYEKVFELDISFYYENKARFRVNICRDDGHVRIVMRIIPLKILNIDELNLPSILKKLCKLKNGLILITGPTGSGKSTTLAAMIDEINNTRPEHIVTIEDPLEFVHKDKQSIITQREIGHDTLSFANALRAALRQDPDVILIGEMRDTETVRTALSSAETGHLVLSTLHTVDAVETLNRIIEFFEPHQQMFIRKQLASVLRAVVSQRIVPLASGTGRCVAAEILIGTRAVRDFIEQGKPFRDIVSLIQEGKDQYGMQTFDQALFDLWEQKKISTDIALSYATSPKDLKLKMQGLNVR